MSGKRAKALRRQARESGIGLLKAGQRGLKKAWAETPWTERAGFNSVLEVRRAREGDEDRVRRWLATRTPEQLAEIKRRVSGSKPEIRPAG